MTTDWLGAALVWGLGGYVTLSTVGYIANAWNRDWWGNKKDKYRDVSSTAVERTSAGTAIARAVAFLVCPVSCVAAFVGACRSPVAARALFPAMRNSYGVSLRSVMPIFANTRTEAFQLGQAYQSLKAAIDAAGGNAAAASASAVQAALKAAALIAGRNVTTEELLKFPADLLLQEQEKGVAARILGAMSLVNIVWLIAILGMTALVVPVMYIITKPLQDLLYNLWTKVIVPFFIATKRLYEPVGYLAAVGLFIESSRYPVSDLDTTGTMVAVSSVALGAVSWMYTTYLNSTGGGNFSVWMGLSGLFVSGLSAAAAVAHNSTLLGYAAVVGLLSSLGFTAVGAPLCICIGFNNREQLLRTALTCLLMTMGNASLRVINADNAAWLQPFQSAVNVFGTSVYFLALSIESVHGGKRGKAIYAANLVLYTVIGSIMGMPGMKNAALSWGAIEALILFCTSVGPSSPVLVGFTACAATYAASLYVSSHPQLITALLTGQ